MHGFGIRVVQSGEQLAALVNIASMPYTVATDARTAQSAAIGATSLFSVVTTGMYEISFSGAVTTAATTSSKIGDFQIRYTDPTDSVLKTTSTQNNVSSSTANTTASCISGTLSIHAKTGTNIDLIMGYTSAGATAMVYKLTTKIKFIP